MVTAAPPQPSLNNLPNQLTALRLVLSVVLFALIAHENWIASLIVFGLAALTDWLDGYVARLQGLTSSFGRNFDPLVDKVLIGGAYIFLLPVPNAGLVPWMVTLVVGRELIITGLRSFVEGRGANFGADWLGKIKMVLQCAALIAIFMYLEWKADWLVHVRDGFIWAMIGATALSGLQYLWRAARVIGQ